MMPLLFVSMLAWSLSVFAHQAGPAPTEVEACGVTAVTIATATPKIAAGSRPQFSVVVANNGKAPLRVLDVRNGRRTDLQDVYFELFIVEEAHVVDLARVISDPGPIAKADYLTLRPRERMQVQTLNYKRMAERLPPGAYSAFILFWRDPEEPHTTRCRSNDVRFVVSE